MSQVQIDTIIGAIIAGLVVAFVSLTDNPWLIAAPIFILALYLALARGRVQEWLEPEPPNSIIDLSEAMSPQRSEYEYVPGKETSQDFTTN